MAEHLKIGTKVKLKNITIDGFLYREEDLNTIWVISEDELSELDPEDEYLMLVNHHKDGSSTIIWVFPDQIEEVDNGNTK